MYVLIQLPVHPTTAQAKEAMDTIGRLAGMEVLRELAGTFAEHINQDAPQPEAVFTGGKMPAPAAPPPPATGPVVLDSTGLPWDARIHSGAKSTNKDGTWKAKKNVPDADKATVTAELRALYPAPAAAPAAPPPPPPHMQPHMPVEQTRPAAPPPPAPVPGAAPTNFIELMKKVTPLMAAKAQGGRGVTPAQWGEAWKSAGISTIAELAGRPDLIPVVDAMVDALTA